MGGIMEIKSAYEIAMEKVEKIGDPTEEERLGWQYVPEGEKLAAKHLRGEVDLKIELGKYDFRSRKYVIDSALSTLIKNISLPKNEIVNKTNTKAIEGIKELKNDKVKIENILNQMRRIFSHYNEQGEQQRKQAYKQVKEAFEIKVQKAMQLQGGDISGVKINIEKQPQFQEEWRRVQNQLDAHYINLLDGLKKEIQTLS